MICRRRAPQWTVVLLLVLLAGSSANGADKTGPWDVARILATPTAPVVQATRDAPGCTVQSIRYPSESFRGTPTEVFAYLAKPTEGQTPYPAMLLVHGGGGTAFEEWARLWAQRGYVALAMDLAGCGPDGQRLPHGGPPQDDDSKFGLTETSPLEEAWSYQAVAAVLRGHALLAQLPDVDPAKIGITGISWGGYLTCIVAGIDHRLSVAVPVYGCGYLDQNSAWQDAGRFAKFSPAARDRWLSNFDPSRYLAGVECPTLFVNGTNDFAYPLDSYKKSYELVRAPRTLCVTVNMPHGHQAGWAPPEIGAFVDHILRQGPELIQLGPLEVRGADVSATIRGDRPPAGAQIHFSTDTGRWQERKWTSQPAEFDAGSHQVRARLPEQRPLVAFLTVQDASGLTVSTEHQELPAEGSGN